MQLPQDFIDKYNHLLGSEAQAFLRVLNKTQSQDFAQILLKKANWTLSNQSLI